MTTSHVSPELASFQEEPRQLPSGGVGKNAFLRLGFERRGERTVLAQLDRRAPLPGQQALYWDEALPDLPCVFIITTTGCILQGDRFNIEIDLAPDTRAHVTTQAATKIHSMDANYAAQTRTSSGVRMPIWNTSPIRSSHTHMPASSPPLTSVYRPAPRCFTPRS